MISYNYVLETSKRSRTQALIHIYSNFSKRVGIDNALCFWVCFSQMSVMFMIIQLFSLCVQLY